MGGLLCWLVCRVGSIRCLCLLSVLCMCNGESFGLIVFFLFF